MNDPKVIVALDYSSAEQAVEFARRARPDLCRLKVGKELFTSAGPAVVDSLQNLGYEIFLDLKFHDIPNTVMKACRAAANLGVWMMNVHASGGRAMMEAAREGVETASYRSFIIAVTVLTSMTQRDLAEMEITSDLEKLVVRLCGNTLESGLDGVVCSAREAPLLRREFGDSALLVTPGIRPEWAAQNDQSRIVSPSIALRDGSSYLVIGRPVTEHSNPLEALDLINQEINFAD